MKKIMKAMALGLAVVMVISAAPTATVNASSKKSSKEDTYSSSSKKSSSKSSSKKDSDIWKEKVDSHSTSRNYDFDHDGYLDKKEQSYERMGENNIAEGRDRWDCD